MRPITHWKGRPIAVLSRDDLVKALSEATAPQPVELPPMVRGTVFAPATRPEQVRLPARKGGV